MDALVEVGAAAAGLVLGGLFPGFQHRLYSEAEFRAGATRGRKLLALRVYCALAAATVCGLAVRLDDYDAFARGLTVVFGLVLVALSSTDFDRRRIPNVLTYPAAVAAALFCWAWPDRSVGDIALGGGIAIAVAALLVVLRFGGGDSKLVVLIGLILGWPGLLPAFFYGVIVGGIVAVVLLVLRGRGSTFAYGPYLAAGALAVLLFPKLA